MNFQLTLQQSLYEQYYIFFKALIKTNAKAPKVAATNSVVLGLKYLVIIPAPVATSKDDTPVKILSAKSWPVAFIFSLVNPYIKVCEVIITNGVVNI